MESRFEIDSKKKILTSKTFNSLYFYQLFLFKAKKRFKDASVKYETFMGLLTCYSNQAICLQTYRASYRQA